MSKPKPSDILFRKKVRTCYIDSPSHKLISETGKGNFSAGLDVCAKEFSQFAKGSSHYLKSTSRIKRLFAIKGQFDFNDLISEAVADGHHLQGMFIALSCLMNSGEITVDVNANIKKGMNWTD